MQELLTEQELGFLLDASQPQAVAKKGEAHSDTEDEWSPLAAAFSDDLQDVDLAVVLTTLRRAGREGVIVVTNALEEHHLWVRDDKIADWVPSRVASRRLGQRLIRAGLISEEEIEDCLTRHEEVDLPVGQALIADGLVTQEQIDDTTRNQALEDIYSLFVWTDGTVQVRSGPPNDDEQAWPDNLQAFDIDEILDEVDRRRVDWEPILAGLGSLNEVIVACSDGQMDGLEERHELVLSAMDGKSSLLDIAQRTKLGVFDCALAIKDLHEWRMVGTAPTDELLTLARDRVAEGEHRRAVVLLRNIIKRNEVSDIGDISTLGDLLARCKEKRKASEYLLMSAYGRSSAAERVELARQASEIAPRSAKILAYYRDRLLETGASDEELYPVSCSLADLMIRDGWLEEAMEVVERFSADTSGDNTATSLRVRALSRLNRRDEAVGELLTLVARCPADDTGQLEVLYEQILRLDSGRSDIEAALQGLHRQPRRLMFAGVAAAVVGLAVVVWLLSSGTGIDREKLDQWVAGVRTKIDAGEPEAAMRMLDASVEFAGVTEARELREQVEGMLARARAEHEEGFLSKLTVAADRLDAGDVEGALELYRALRTKSNTARVDKVVRARFEGLIDTLKQQANGLAGRVPPAPSAITTEREVLAVLSKIEATFQPPDLERAKRLLATDPKLLETMIGEEHYAALSAALTGTVAAFEDAARRKGEYEAARDRASIRRKLAGLWKAAKSHEEKFDFEKAHEIYVQLAREYPEGKDGLRAVFESHRDRYESIIRDMKDLAESTQRGDLETSTQLFAFMKKHEPNVPFDRLVRLPLRVATAPPGATVTVGGEKIGETPLVTAFRPSDEPMLRIELDGFEPVQHKIRRKEALQFNVLLTRAPEWIHRVKGLVEQRAVFDREGSAYVADRSGRVTALRRDSGDQLWQLSTLDLSGLLPTPVLWRDKLVVTSLDGPVRCLERKTANPVWEVENLPCEGAPVAVGDVLYVGTAEGHLVLLDLNSEGRVLAKTALPGAVTRDLQVQDQRVYLVTANGWVVCVDARRARRGNVLWKKQIGNAIEATPCVASDLLAVGNTEGTLLALDLASGKTLWSQRVAGNALRHCPLSVGSRILVTVGDRLIGLGRTDGKRDGEYQGKAPFSAGPSAVGDRLLVGDRRGVVAVLDARSLELCYQLRGESAVAGPVTVSPDGWILVGFEDRSVFCYKP